MKVDLILIKKVYLVVIICIFKEFFNNLTKIKNYLMKIY